MIPRHPSGTLLSKSDPVGAAGNRAPVAGSTSTSSPARSLALFTVGAWLSRNTRASCGISQAIGLAVAEHYGHGKRPLGSRGRLRGLVQQWLSSLANFTFEPPQLLAIGLESFPPTRESLA